VGYGRQQRLTNSNKHQTQNTGGPAHPKRGSVACFPCHPFHVLPFACASVLGWEAGPCCQHHCAPSSMSPYMSRVLQLTLSPWVPPHVVLPNNYCDWCQKTLRYCQLHCSSTRNVKAKGHGSQTHFIGVGVRPGLITAMTPKRKVLRRKRDTLWDR
jgi:hypothetical protein